MGLCGDAVAARFERSMNIKTLISVLVFALFCAIFIFWGQGFLQNREKFPPAENPNDLSAPETATMEEKPITLLFVGDIMLSRAVAKQMEKYQNNNWPFLKISTTTREADLAFGNLEGPISYRGTNQGSIYSFRAQPEAVEGLKFAGFDILSVANNHIFDYGREALLDTISILKNNGIETVGAGENYEEANKFLIKDVNGVKIAFAAYTNLYPENLEADNDSAGISSFGLEEIKSKIGKIKSFKFSDIVVISLHWGEEYKLEPNLTQRNIAHSLIESGADLIIGHHPHVIQEVENYKNGWIAYSLGNFVFDQYFSEETMEGLILRVAINDEKIFNVSQEKIKINNAFQPEIKSL